MDAQAAPGDDVLPLPSCFRRPAPHCGGLPRLGLIALALALGACSTAHYRVNPPLAQPAGPAAYATRHLAAAGNSDSLLVFATLSGGGYRASALAYAVLEALRETPIRWEGSSRTMLQEVDAISAVSGGALAAAYLAAQPDAFFDEFPRRVLGFDLQGALLRRAFSPSGLWKQTSPTYGRGDLLEELLVEHVFGERTYGELPRRRPMVYINATDMHGGEPFQFSQDSFDRLCSDLNRLPIARAVAASMAVPILFSPITLWNHRPGCAVTPPEIRGKPVTRRYLHLVDGGVADNTGVRAFLEIIRANGGPAEAAQRAGLVGVRKRVFVVVNAQTAPAEPPDDDAPQTPGLVQQIGAAVKVPVDRHSQTTLMHLGDTIRLWERDVRLEGAGGPRPGADDRFYLVEISIANARSDGATAVNRIPTGLRLTAGEFEEIRAFARAELAANPEWRRLLQDLQRVDDEASRPRERTDDEALLARTAPAVLPGSDPASRSTDAGIRHQR